MQGSGGPSRGVKFLGSYTHTIDEKGRVSLPAPFRREAADQRLVLAQPYPNSLALYPEVEWGQVEARLEDLLSKGEEERLFVLGQLEMATEVTPDSQGRILIPSRLKDAAGLGTSVKMVGAITKIELWSPERFETDVGGRSTGSFEKFRSQLFR